MGDATWTVNTTGDYTNWNTTTSGTNTIMVQVQPEPEKPKDETALEWLDRRIDETRQVAGFKQAA